MNKTPLNPVSKSRKRRLNRFIPIPMLMAVKERSGGQCERILTIVGQKVRCNRPAMSQPDHKLARSQARQEIKHTLENLTDLCFECHFWKTNNPRLAIEEGLTLPYEGYKP